MTRHTLLRLGKGASVFIFLALCIAVLRVLDPGADDLSAFVQTHIRSHGLWGHGYFVVLAGMLTCVGVPRQLVAFAGGYAFGMILGTIWATCGTLLGCALSFFYARFVGRGSVERRLSKQVRKINDLVCKAPLAMTICIRLLPVGSNLLFCLLGGVSRIPAIPFLIGSGIGYIPQNLIFALLGSGIRVEPFWRTLISAILFGISTLFGWWIYRRMRLNRTLENGADNENTTY